MRVEALVAVELWIEELIRIDEWAAPATDLHVEVVVAENIVDEGAPLEIDDLSVDADGLECLLIDRRLAGKVGIRRRNFDRRFEPIRESGLRQQRLGLLDVRRWRVELESLRIGPAPLRHDAAGERDSQPEHHIVSDRLP